MRRNPLALAAIVLCTAWATPGSAQVRLAGTITAATEASVTLQPEGGAAVEVALPPNLAVARLVRATMADLKPGLFVGVGARPQADGTQKAVQIVIFPETMRGTGEGHRAWGVMPEATMTNGAIAETVQAVSGPSFTLNYKDGTQKVTTPADAAILALQPGDRSMVKPGARGQVIAARNPDGTLLASRLTLWGEGVTPY